SEEISFKQILQQAADGETARLVIVTHEMSKTQLENVTDKLSKETDFTVLNTFKVLGE
ncbi:TPA: homoserine dehydrogenase, partial [Streptococcus suis]|nr:homoserine dehydrogenase [Streptococcus suis]